MGSNHTAIVGWGHTPFGKFTGRNVEDLIIDAATQALETSGVPAKDVDAIFLGHFNAGMAPDGFASSLVMQADPDLRFKPATRYENACASGSAAVYGALDAIAGGRVKIALVVGVEKMTDLDTASVAKSLSAAGYQNDAEEAGKSFPGVFASFARAYFERYGDQLDALAMIAAKNHRNALSNPWAHLKKDVGFEFCNTVSDKNPIIAAPLRMTDCSLISDGAAAIVLASPDVAQSFGKAVAFRAASHVSDYLPVAKRDPLAFEGAKRAFDGAYTEAGVSVGDLDFAEVHDCFTIAELLIYEAMGLAEKGHGRAVLDEGIVMADGRLPINLSGGAESQRPPRWRKRCLHARIGFFAVDGAGWRHAGQGRTIGRRVQHGRLGSRQLCINPGDHEGLTALSYLGAQPERICCK